jgi:hypothetical protein
MPRACDIEMMNEDSWRHWGATTENQRRDDVDVVDKTGSPGWTRTSDILITGKTPSRFHHPTISHPAEIHTRRPDRSSSQCVEITGLWHHHGTTAAGVIGSPRGRTRLADAHVCTTVTSTAVGQSTAMETCPGGDGAGSGFFAARQRAQVGEDPPNERRIVHGGDDQHSVATAPSHQDGDSSLTMSLSASHRCLA